MSGHPTFTFVKPRRSSVILLAFESPFHKRRWIPFVDRIRNVAIIEFMKVAKKSPVRRRTVTLPLGAFSLLDRLRGQAPRSTYLEMLLEHEHHRIEQERFHTEVNAAYTAEVCEETLRVNEEFPVHEE
jgi:hypothetical protein